MLDLRDTGRSDLAELEGRIARDRPDLRAPLVLVWTDVPLLLLDHGHPWVIGPIERDPLARGGRTVVPAEQRRQLTRLADRPLPFQRLAIAHELDPDGPVRTLLPTLRSGPRLCTDEVAVRVAGPLPAHPGTARLARALDALVGSAATAARTGAELLLDPVIFGVVASGGPVHGQPGLYYPLTAWRW